MKSPFVACHINASTVAAETSASLRRTMETQQQPSAPFATVAYLNTKAASFFNFHQLFFSFFSKGAFIFLLILRVPEFPGNTWFLFIPDHNLCTKPIKLQLPSNKCLYHFKAIETVCKHSIYIHGRYGKVQFWGKIYATLQLFEKNISKSCKKAALFSSAAH